VSLLIIGCGYVGQQVARMRQSQGNHVIALTRGGDNQTHLAQLGFETLVADWLDSAGDWHCPGIRQALVAVPHRADERWGEQTHCVGLGNLLSRLPQLERLVVLSTTGVYHQSQGEWVDEASPTQPERIGPRIALAAERWLAEHVASGAIPCGTSLRLAGIYGPGRVPLLAKLRTGEAIPVAEGVLNLIHVTDIAQAILRLLEHPAPSQLYVLSDGQPVDRLTFYSDAAKIFQTSAPKFTEPDPDTSRAARSQSCKRVNPSRILHDLQLRLTYPNHWAGLTAIAAQERSDA
jgi:nucleoside-diphosphate-sugar epimerase